MTFATTLGPYTHDGQPFTVMLQQMVQAAAVSLAQSARGTPELFGLWHDQFDGTQDRCDQLTAHVAEFVPIRFGEFPTPANEIDRCHPLDYEPRVTLSLRRVCAQLPDEQGRIDSTDEGASAEDLLTDARALQCGVMATWPGILQGVYGPHMRIQWGPMTPTASGGHEGWDWSILLETQQCRAGCGQ